MNKKFYSLPEEKQKKILNAAYMVFALNKYRKAPMSEVADAGGISKSLLFHYFTNKKELYLYLWDNAVTITDELKAQCEVFDTYDFFELLRRSLEVKCSIMRKYPYLSLFVLNAYYETDDDIAKAIYERTDKAEKISFDLVESKVDLSSISSDTSFEEIYRNIVFASEGMIADMYRKRDVDVEMFSHEYLCMIDHWEKIYGRKNL